MGTAAYNFISFCNKFDMQMYKYVEALFEEQTHCLVGVSMPGGFWLYGESCSKCIENNT